VRSGLIWGDGNAPASTPRQKFPFLWGILTLIQVLGPTHGPYPQNQCSRIHLQQLKTQSNKSRILDFEKKRMHSCWTNWPSSL